MSGLSVMYVTGSELEDYFVSNQTGLPLAGGSVYFYVDSNRTQAKTVYELNQGSGWPPAYTYTPLPNPVVLSNTGTIMDANGNNVALYYYPYDSFGNVQLYYVEVYDSQGNLQFTREAWPYPNLPVAMAVTSVTASLPLASSGGTTPNIYIAEAIPVDLGGTGVTALNPPYGVICAGTSTTNPVQVVSTLGTSGQVLTSNGANTLPSWQNATGGEFQLIDSQTASSSASINFTGLTTDYVAYELYITNLLVSTTANLTMTMNGDTAAHYSYAWTYTATSVGSPGSIQASTTANILLLENLTNTQSSAMKLILYNPAYVDQTCTTWNSCYINSSSPVALVTVNGAAHRFVSESVTNFNITVSAGVIASGFFTLYGIKAT